MEEREYRPRAGEFYRHFKNKIYQIITVAIHSETEEEMVVYQALYGDFKVYVRPLAMFMSEVDHKKYPNVVQKYRFERIEFGKGMERDQIEDLTGKIYDSANSIQDLDEDGEANPYLLDFLAADTYEEKLRTLARMRGHVGQIELDAIAMTLDIQPMRGDFQQQLDTFVQYVRTQQRYDGTRLR